MLAACVTTTTKHYLPTPGQPRITQNQLREQLDALLRIECPRLMGGTSSALGDAEFGLEVSRGGEVMRATLDRTSGDLRMDDIFGALVAELRFEPPATTDEIARGRLTVGYSCSPTAAVSTVQVTP
ncbi:MAG TPA: hypothetical protein VJ596_04835 [Gemmatimonadaceae bacterium]|nr:hypothetical protein [Gemmatimonadaceae bacterium]